MPICRKCERPFPNKFKIDGKVRNLQRRKFCLDCSPFGGRNTKPDDPARSSVKKQVNGKRVPYSKWDERFKERNRAMQYYYRHRRLQEIINLKGGACKVCGYDKCTRALNFHHRDPGNKCFELNTRDILSHSKSEIYEEVEKCDLLCANCHAELHSNEQQSKHLPTIVELYGEGWLNI